MANLWITDDTITAAKLNVTEQTTTLTGTQHDFAVTQHCAITHLRCNNASALTLTGFKVNAETPKDGAVLIVSAVGAGSVTLADQDAGSTAAHRIITGLGASLLIDRAVLVYDAATARWRVVSPQANYADGILQRPELKDYAETKTAPAISAGVLTLNIENGNTFDVSLNANVTTLTISNPPASGKVGSFTLIFTADGTQRTVTWPAAVKWPAGNAPTLTATNAKKDIFAFLTVDGGTNWFAVIVGQNF